MVAVVIVAGFQEPVIPLVDIANSDGAVIFWQRGPICVNVGVIWLAMTTVIVTGMAH